MTNEEVTPVQARILKGIALVHEQNEVILAELRLLAKREEQKPEYRVEHPELDAAKKPKKDWSTLGKPKADNPALDNLTEGGVAFKI